MNRQLFSQAACRLGLVASLAALCGCGTTMNTVEPAQTVGQRQMVNDKRLLTDAGLDRKVRIIGLNVANTPAGLLKVNVEVENLRRSVQQFNYSIEWFDQDGMPVGTTTSGAWIHREILARETLNLTAVAPTPGARDFKIKFIEDIR